MPNYLLAYHGGGAMAQDEAERKRLMAQWGKWFQDLGEALVDGGNPIMKAKTISSKGAGAGRRKHDRSGRDHQGHVAGRQNRSCERLCQRGGAARRFPDPPARLGRD